MTPEDRELWDAHAEEKGWRHAVEILEPMREIARMVGSPELIRVLEKAFGEAETELNRALDPLELLLGGIRNVPRRPRWDRNLAALSCAYGALSEAVERLGPWTTRASPTRGTTGGPSARYPRRAASSLGSIVAGGGSRASRRSS